MRRSRQFILGLVLIAVVLSMSALVTSCSSEEAENEGVTSTPQAGGPSGGMSPNMGISEDLLSQLSEILDIDQQTLEDAFNQAQSEMMADMPEDGQPPSASPDASPPEDMFPEGEPPEGTLPEDMMPEGVPREGMSPGWGISDDLLARVAEILGIDQQTLEDAFNQAQSEISVEATPPTSDQSGSGDEE